LFAQVAELDPSRTAQDPRLGDGYPIPALEQSLLRLQNEYPSLGRIDVCLPSRGSPGVTRTQRVQHAAAAIHSQLQALLLARDDAPSATHSIDFRSVNWFGRLFEFTPNQAACLRVLWEHWERRTPDVGQAAVLEVAESSSERLDLVFRNHDAWGVMIVPGGTKGAFRLQPPAGESDRSGEREKAHVAHRLRTPPPLS
jgi:hypothetical protein